MWVKTPLGLQKLVFWRLYSWRMNMFLSQEGRVKMLPPKNTHYTLTVCQSPRSPTWPSELQTLLYIIPKGKTGDKSSCIFHIVYAQEETCRHWLVRDAEACLLCISPRWDLSPRGGWLWPDCLSKGWGCSWVISAIFLEAFRQLVIYAPRSTFTKIAGHWACINPR